MTEFSFLLENPVCFSDFLIKWQNYAITRAKIAILFVLCKYGLWYNRGKSTGGVIDVGYRKLE